VSERRQVRVRVRGLVQGVFFREGTRRAAEQAGVAGCVGNLPDGSVEAVLEGPPQAVERLLDFVRRGPPDAVVREVEVSEEAPEGLSGFSVW
jgi:acylphosphatase